VQKRSLFILLGVLLLLVSVIMSELWLQLRATSAPAADPLIIPPDHPRHLINFSLLDQNGREVTRQTFKHKIVVVNFLFTTCSIVCPYVTDQMAQIQRQTAGQKDVILLSLTVDPADDTVAVLSQYAQKAGADPARWCFLTGNEEVVQNLIGTSFLAHDTNTNFSSMPGSFANSHSIVLVDTNGQIVKNFDGLNLNAAHAVIQEIQKLRKSTP
jgi:protein SCO1